jgi:GT2 family glycosyltransferase
VRAVVVIPTLDARELLLDALDSLAAQTVPPAEIVVVDNASRDGTAEAVVQRHPDVSVVRLPRNVGFGRAVNHGFARAAASCEALVLVNNDCVCEPGFLDALLEPLADPAVGMVAGVLLQGDAPELVDSAGIELDSTLGSWDLAWNRPAAEIGEREPVGPCGGAAAYRASAFTAAGGFDETLFAYWEDVELALRLRLAGWRCAFAPRARATHHHGATLGAASPAQRRLEAFGRGYVLGRYDVPGRGIATRLRIAALDWPGLAVHLLARRELGPIRARARGLRLGRGRTPLRAPLELATVSFPVALGRHLDLLRLRFTGRLPRHFSEHGPAGTRG